MTRLVALETNDSLDFTLLIVLAGWGLLIVLADRGLFVWACVGPMASLVADVAWSLLLLRLSR
jgi:hypothetical protein